MASDPATVVREYWMRLWVDGDLGAIGELIADPYVRHSSNGNLVRDHTAVRGDMTGVLDTLSSRAVTVDDQAVAGDTVWTRLTLHGVNVETEEHRTVSWLHVARVSDGRITESWSLNAPVDWKAPPAR